MLGPYWILDFQLDNTQKRGGFHLAFALSITLCITQQNLSIGVNIVSKGSPSRIFNVRRISLGITIRPRSSTLLTIPVAVPDIFVGFQKPSSSVDRGHSLRRSTRCTFPFPASRKFHQHLGFSSPHKGRSPLRGPQLTPPPAALPSLPSCFHIFLLFVSAGLRKGPLV